MSYDKHVTITDKQDAHRERMRAGRRMVRLLEGRSLDEMRSFPHVDEDTTLDRERRKVWAAEYESLRLDPELRYVPRDVAPPPDTQE